MRLSNYRRLSISVSRQTFGWLMPDRSNLKGIYLDQEKAASEPSVLDSIVPGLRILPQNLLSLAVGALVRTRLPAFVAKPANKLFVKAFGINMAEAEKPLASYRTVEDVFTRKLQPGSRKIAEGFVSPADGLIVKSEAVHVGRAIQAKGMTYSLSELVFGAHESPRDFDPSWFTTVYLAPHNYHRVHTPCAATAINLRYIPGRLWPVNGPAVRAIPGLFCRNERLVFDLLPKQGGRLWVVMVGALNVGRIVTPLKPDFASNSSFRLLDSSDAKEHAINAALNAGDEIGTFMLGSTVVLVLDREAAKNLAPKALSGQRNVRMGESLSFMG